MPLKPQHDKNLSLSDQEKTELYRVTLERLLSNKKMSDYLSMKDTRNIVISTQDIDPSLIPKISGINITFMTPEEIKEKVTREGTFGFLYCYPLEAEGSRVQVTIMYRQDKKIAQNLYEPCCGALGITFHKKDGKWVEEDSIGSRI
jgi:hypothetical protein